MTGAIEAELNNIRTDSIEGGKKTNAVSGRQRKGSVAPPKPSYGLPSSALSPEEVRPELQLLRGLGVPLPPEPREPSAVNSALEAALSDRVAKLSGHTVATATSIESALATHLQESGATIQQLYDVLLSDTPYREVNLVDKELSAMLEALDAEINSLESNLADVDTEKLHERDTFRDQFLKRWVS